jgi:hypothetical protein
MNYAVSANDLERFEDIIEDYYISIRLNDGREPERLDQAFRVIIVYVTRKGGRIRTNNLRELVSDWLAKPAEPAALPERATKVQQGLYRVQRILRNMREEHPRFWRGLDKTHMRWSPAIHWQFNEKFRQRVWLFLLGQYDDNSSIPLLTHNVIYRVVYYLARLEAVRVF